MTPTNDKDKMQKLAGIQKEPAKPTHYYDYHGQRIFKYSDGTIRVHNETFPTTQAAMSYIDHISR